LYQRNDDTLETARHRLDVYFAQTMPLIEHYRKQGLLREIDGQREITQVTRTMLQLMERDGSHTQESA
jgi:adenylate kinase